MLDGRCSLRAAEAVGVALDKLRGRLDRPDGLIDNQSAETAVHNMITSGVLMALAQGAGGYRDDDPQLVALRTELTALAARPACQRERVEAAFVLLAQRMSVPGPAWIPAGEPEDVARRPAAFPATKTAPRSV